MTQRLQVLLDDAEFAEIRRIARRHRMTVAEWVRQALRTARRDEPRYEAERKLAVLREATAYNFPTAEMDEILSDIERGRLGDLE
ncbi:MAG: antitoxin [Gemmatimonas sp.]|nr:antitoxin [Gemmatimonas sp.]